MRLEFESNASTLLLNKVEFFDDAAFDAPQAQPSLRSGIEAVRAGNHQEARRLLLSAAEAEPRNEAAWLCLAFISEYPEELLFFLNNVLDINPTDERALEWLKATKSQLAENFAQRGIDAANSEQNNHAKQCFYQAAVYDSKNETAWLWLAFLSDSSEEKRAHLDKVLNINPQNESARKALQNVYDEMAQSLLSKAVDVFAADRQTANEMIDQALHKSPQLIDAWLLKSHLTENFEEKVVCYEKILEIKPNHDAASAGLKSLQTFMKNGTAKEKSEVFRAEHKEANADAADNPVLENTDESNLFAERSNHNNSAQETGFELPSSENDELPVGNEPENTLSEAEESVTGEENSIKEESFNVAEKGKSEVELEMESQVYEDRAEATDDRIVLFDDSEPIFMFSEQSETDEVNSNKNEENNRKNEDSTSRNVTFATDSGGDDELFQVENLNSNVFEFADEEPEQDDLTQREANSEECVFAVNDAAVISDVSHTDEARKNNFYKEDNMLELENYQAENQYSNELNLSDEVLFEESDSMKIEERDEPVENRNQLRETILKISPKFQTEFFDCPFCSSENDVQAFACGQCCAVLSLSDLEMLLGNRDTDREILGRAVERMEVGRDMRGLSENELLYLGIGHINLKNFRQGFSYLQQASQANPNDVILSSQVNALAIRVEEIERKEEVHESQMKGRKILVVDDSATVRKLISGKLEKSGHEVVCAVDGMDALAKLNEISPDLILLDITMPRMDGYQVCKLVRGNPLTKDIPVVMISGKDGFFDKVRGRMAGTTGYITKPFGPETLMKALEVYIKNGAGEIYSEEDEFISVEA